MTLAETLRCDGCKGLLGIEVDPRNEPDAIIVTCRCGAMNFWRPQ